MQKKSLQVLMLVHDSRILRRSELFGVMNQRTDSILLGDVGYGIHSWLTTLFKPTINPQDVVYNELLSKERVIIERCIGQSQSQTRKKSLVFTSNFYHLLLRTSKMLFKWQLVGAKTES